MSEMRRPAAPSRALSAQALRWARQRLELGSTHASNEARSPRFKHPARATLSNGSADHAPTKTGTPSGAPAANILVAAAITGPCEAPKCEAVWSGAPPSKADKARALSPWSSTWPKPSAKARSSAG